MPESCEGEAGVGFGNSSYCCDNPIITRGQKPIQVLVSGLIHLYVFTVTGGTTILS